MKSYARVGALSGVLSGALAALMPLAPVVAQTTVQQAPTQSWTVRPEWVRAHEEFLASDAMRGRGSATHDEEVAATYVASEFEGYGLTTAPGMSGYIQQAAVSAPELSGTATLDVGGMVLHEGSDFELLTSSGAPVRGVLRKSSALGNTPFAGAVVLVDSAATGSDPLHGAGRFLQGGAAAVLMPESGALDTLGIQMGGKTRVTARLAGTPGGGGPTIVLLRPAAMTRLAAVQGGATVDLAVHVLPSAPRATYNAIGYLQGTDPSSGTILLSAHLDHLGVGRPVAGDSIYNGADDDAAGTTAVLELAHALAAGPRLRRNVLFVCYGSEEIGELGSTYFGEHPPVPLSSLVANIEFEMIGVRDPKTVKGELLFTGWDRSNLGPTLQAHGALIGPDPYPEQHFFERSDNYALALKGVVAHTAAGWGTPPIYHEVDDDLAHLDIRFMTAAIQSLVAPVRWLASSDFTPAWNPGGRPQPK